MRHGSWLVDWARQGLAGRDAGAGLLDVCCVAEIFGRNWTLTSGWCRDCSAKSRSHLKVLTGSVGPAVKMLKLQRVVECIGCGWSLAWAGSAKTKKAAL
ncbi:hypothetical protein NL676_010775 [Syzygium grande]|nr:hypothetical protein NL676_010775 [Syzygium grande]